MDTKSNNYTREEWAKAVLLACGNTNPSSLLVSWLVVWTVFETSPQAKTVAAYNLLNTIQSAPGATQFNSAGVKNFVSFEQGTKVTAKVLQNGYYPHIYQALLLNDVNSLLHNDYLINPELHTWGTACHASDIARWLGQLPTIDTETFNSGKVVDSKVPDSTVRYRTEI